MNYNDLREVLTLKKVSIKELTEQIGYTRQGLQSALDNQTIELRKLKLLCEVLKISPEKFFDGFVFSNQDTSQGNEKIIIESLKREIELLREKIEDKEEIINLLKDSRPNRGYSLVSE